MKSIKACLFLIFVQILLTSCITVTTLDEMMERCGRYDGGIKSSGLPIIEYGKINVNENNLQGDNTEGISISFRMEEWGRMITKEDSISRTLWFTPNNYSYSIPICAEGFLSCSGKNTTFKVEGWLGESSLYNGGIKNGDLYGEWLIVDGEDNENVTFNHRNWYMDCFPDCLMEIRLPKEKNYPLGRQAFVQSCSIEKYEHSSWESSRDFQDDPNNPLKDSREGLKYQLYVYGEPHILLAEWTDSEYTIFGEYSTLDLEQIRLYIALSCAYMNAYDQVNGRIWYGIENGDDVRWKYNRVVREFR